MNTHKASQASGTTSNSGSVSRRIVMLVMATAGFAINFWAWALLSPLAPEFKDALHLTSLQQALVVAVPVVVGSLGRIPVGALTDRYGARIMFPLVSVTTIVPVLYLGLSGHASLAGLLVGGFFLGIGGTAFAVGVPFVNAWFPPERRGLAIGIFGMGMGGTAISALTTVNLVTANGTATPFIIMAGVLAAYALVAAFVLRDAPGRAAPAESFTRRLAATARLRITWQAAALYAVAFGGYVAFSVYLPSYLKTGYGLTQADAANRMAGFVLLAVLMRPVGGWLSDRYGPARVLAYALGVVSIGAFAQSFAPSLVPAGTIAFLSMAAALGAASGATFALVAMLAPADKVGSVTGVVGAAGGLGGFVPPLVMGLVYGQLGSYAVGLIALAIVAASAVVFTATAVRRAIRSGTAGAGPAAAGAADASPAGAGPADAGAAGAAGATAEPAPRQRTWSATAGRKSS
jgi:NNP family nitrate/nitrite transporter-like MFS transporter